MTLGAYMGLAFIGVAGLSPWWALPAAMIGMALVAVAIDQLVYRRIRRTQPVILLISSFGMALILRSLIQLIWGSDNQTYASGIQFPWRLDWLGGLRLKPDHAWIVLISLGLIVTVHLFLSRTRLGKAMRAMSDNMDLALVTGIPAERVIMMTWIIGGALAGAAGVFLGIDTRLHPVMGWTALLPIFAATILGGIGRPYGAIVGGMVIGISMEMSTLFMPAAYKPAVAFAILVAMLIVRPQGIFKGTL